MRGDRSGPPVGRAFAVFLAASALLMVAVVWEVSQWDGADSIGNGRPTYLGAVATTVFAVCGLVGVYRSLTTDEHLAGILGVVLWGPAAVWSAMVFVAAGSGGRVNTIGQTLSDVALVLAAVVAYVLLGRGFKNARWAEVFAGLAATNIVLVSASVSARPLFSNSSVALVSLAIVASMAGLYGLLVDIEVADAANRARLQASNKRLVGVIRGTEDLLHDLRSGLLSIEAAARVSGDNIGPSISQEAARLRKMTMVDEAESTNFDLVAGVKALIETKRASGTGVEFTSPDTAEVHGSESEVLAIVDNLVSNAVRHGRPPLSVDIVSKDEGDQRVTEVSVVNGGAALNPSTLSKWFRRGFTTSDEGDGIGLDRAQRLAERNGAEVIVVAEGTDRAKSTLTLRCAVSLFETPESAESR